MRTEPVNVMAIGTTEEDARGLPVGTVLLTISVNGSEPFRISPDTLARRVAQALEKRENLKRQGSKPNG